MAARNIMKSVRAAVINAVSMKKIFAENTAVVHMIAGKSITIMRTTNMSTAVNATGASKRRKKKNGTTANGLHRLGV
ncbi:hypothetical protein JQN58_18945 [Aneurinibacillus sp. BA2021]|nr:hypothetical protein [Aneurinibacillus sp. BA2021]